MPDTNWQKSADCVGSHIDGTLVLLNIDGGMYFSLNGPAADIWEALDQPCSIGNLVDKLVSKYKITPEPCAASVARLLDDLASKGLAKPLS
jgi:hypothetical protein